MISKIKSEYIENPLLRFGVHAFLLYVLWLFAYHTWGLPRGGFDDKMTEVVGETTSLIVQELGYEVNSVWGQNIRALENEEQNIKVKKALLYELYFDGKKSIMIGNSCNGLLITALYIGFIIAYPGRIRPKIVFIVLGSLLIFISNIARIVALALNWDYYQETFSFNHKYTYVFLVYAIVFLLWMNWVNKYSVTAKTAKG